MSNTSPDSVLAHAAPESTAALVCRVGSLWCALPLACVSETMRPLPTDRLPKTASFVLGVAMIRGAPTPVIDAADLLKVTPSPTPTRYVTLRIDERSAALAVSAVAGIYSQNELQLQPLPPLTRSLGEDAIDALGALDNRLLLVLEAARLVPAAAWQAIEARRTS